MFYTFFLFFSTAKAAFRAAFLLLSTLCLICSCSQESNTSPPPIEKFGYAPNDSNTETHSTSSENKNENAAPKKQQTTLTFSTNYQGDKTKPQSSFDCDQKIYAVLLLQNYPNKLHDIVVKWIDPYDKERESTEIPTYTSNESVYTWSSLSLHRDATAGLLQWINPASGMEEFIGEWQVKIMIEDTMIDSGKFTVVC